MFVFFKKLLKGKYLSILAITRIQESVRCPFVAHPKQSFEALKTENFKFNA